MEEPATKDPNSPRPGTNRVALTFWIWAISAGVAGLVWLGTLDPLGGLPITRPLNVMMFGVCAAMAFGFTAAIWGWHKL